MLFKESEVARGIKEEVGIPDVEFITVANPFNK
jgi:hypothetical protein